MLQLHVHRSELTYEAALSPPFAALGVEVHAPVYFYENPNIKRNVLGRNRWLNRVRPGLVDYDSLVYLSAYDE